MTPAPDKGGSSLDLDAAAQWFECAEDEEVLEHGLALIAEIRSSWENCDRYGRWANAEAARADRAEKRVKALEAGMRAQRDLLVRSKGKAWDQVRYGMDTYLPALAGKDQDDSQSTPNCKQSPSAQVTDAERANLSIDRDKAVAMNIDAIRKMVRPGNVKPAADPAPKCEHGQVEDCFECHAKEGERQLRQLGRMECRVTPLHWKGGPKCDRPHGHRGRHSWQAFDECSEPGCYQGGTPHQHLERVMVRRELLVDSKAAIEDLIFLTPGKSKSADGLERRLRHVLARLDAALEEGR